MIEMAKALDIVRSESFKLYMEKKQRDSDSDHIEKGIDEIKVGDVLAE